MKKLRLAYSPCPNDTFIFHAWVSGLIPGAPTVVETLADIDRLNDFALWERADVIKVSFSALAHVLDRYALLHSGGALGRGCGPLVVVREDSELGADGLNGLSPGRVAVPGALTTAALLTRLFAPGAGAPAIMPFDRIVPAVAAGEVAAGVIIHESRFTYQDYGLRAVVDLGSWWEETTGYPIPLGGIVVRRSLGAALAAEVDAALRASVEAARARPSASWEYTRVHAQEMDPAVCREHIALYVNDYSLDYGPDGAAAIGHLLKTAAEIGAAPGPGDYGVFWDDAPGDTR